MPMDICVWYTNLVNTELLLLSSSGGWERPEVQVVTLRPLKLDAQKYSNVVLHLSPSRLISPRRTFLPSRLSAAAQTPLTGLM